MKILASIHHGRGTKQGHTRSVQCDDTLIGLRSNKFHLVPLISVNSFENKV